MRVTFEPVRVQGLRTQHDEYLNAYDNPLLERARS